jgi:hypothetical protein
LVKTIRAAANPKAKNSQPTRLRLRAAMIAPTAA